MRALLALVVGLVAVAVAVAQVPAVIPTAPPSANELWVALIGGAVAIGGTFLAQVGAFGLGLLQYLGKGRASAGCVLSAAHPPKIEGTAEQVADVHRVLHWPDTEGTKRPMFSGERRRQEDETAARSQKLLEEIRDEQRAIRPELTACFRVMTRLAKRFGDAEDANAAAVKMLEVGE